MENKKKAMLMILDGWGLGKSPEVDAIAQANTAFIDGLMTKYPHSTLVTYGEEVGLPDGQMGNSEVGHLNIGAGRVVYQELARINKAIREKTLQENEVLLNAIKYAKENKKPIHLLGLVSDGGVHSHINHLKAICDLIEKNQLTGYIHAFMDGRDTAQKGGAGYLKDILGHIQDKPVQVASVIGRYYAMDRDNRWERVKLAYDLLVHGKGQSSTDLLNSINDAYEAGTTDEFIKPIITVGKDGKAIATIQEDDVVLFYNFRTDRPREITKVLTQEDMPEYGMKKLPLHFVTMTRYDETFDGIGVIFNKDDIQETLGEVLAKAGKTQVRIAETEKYPHVTFFFSGGREKEFDGEKRIMVKSPKVATYDLQPEMSAGQITDSIIAEIQTNQPDFICLNFANTDMVGHTGVFSAAVKAAEYVDKCVKRIIETALAKNYNTIIIADHGNSDFMVNDDGTPHTAHTKNLVPCILVGNGNEGKQLKDGKLADIAPTILSLMGIEKSGLMTGEDLVL